MRTPLITAAVIALFPYDAAAQFTVPTPSSTECANAIAAVSSGDFSAPNQGSWVMVGRCGPAGAQAIAGTITSLKTLTDTAGLTLLAAAGGSVRDANVFNAALDVSANPGASPGARIASLKILLYQHDPAISITDDVFLGTPSDEVCVLGRTATAGIDTVSPLPPDYLEQMYDVAKEIASGPSTPMSVAGAATCVRDAISYLVTPAIDARSSGGCFGHVASQ